jgi:N-acetylneuraminic acid mutarotase
VSKFMFLAMSLVVLGAPQAQEAVTITSSVDFERGNNEGLISTAEDRLARDRITAGDIGAWSSTSALPSGRAYGEAVAFNGFVYVTGGSGSGFSGSVSYNDVVFASRNTDGTLGPWSSTTPFPGGRREHRSVAYNGHLYVMGGVNDVSEKLRDVQVARFQEDGSVGMWAATTPLPPALGLSCFAAVAQDNHIYVIGGETYNAQAVANVHVAPIHADGTLGDWSAATALPTATAYHDSVAYDGHLYVLGGNDASPGVLSRILVAPIAANGSIGSWSATTSLPSGRSSHDAVAYNGFLYCIGGGQGVGEPLGEVLVAPLNGGGSVGEWSASTAISPARSGAASIAHDGFLYAIGGIITSQGYSTDALVASIFADTSNANQSPDRLRSFHSRLVDLQDDSSTQFITINGQLSPGGAIRLQVRVAPEATKVFGAETVFDSVSPGSAVEVPGNGRYVWIRLTLDDTGTSDVDQPTHVTDITITSFGGVVFDGPGADIDTQASTTTIEANWGGFGAAGGPAIAFYEWAIGTAPGLTDVQGWTHVGSVTSASNSSLSLGAGVKFVSVRATDDNGQTSPVATSDGVQVLVESVAPTVVNVDDENDYCGAGASAVPGSALALLAGLALLVSARRRR